MKYGMCFESVCTAARNFETAQTLAHLLPEILFKASNRVLAALKTSSDVKSESLYRSCLPPISASNGITSPQSYTSGTLTSHRPTIFGRNKHAPRKAFVLQHVSQSKLQVSWTCISCLTVRSPPHSPMTASYGILNPKAASYELRLLLADEVRCALSSSTQETGTSQTHPIVIDLRWHFGSLQTDRPEIKTSLNHLLLEKLFNAWAFYSYPMLTYSEAERTPLQISPSSLRLLLLNGF